MTRTKRNRAPAPSAVQAIIGVAHIAETTGMNIYSGLLAAAWDQLPAVVKEGVLSTDAHDTAVTAIAHEVFQDHEEKIADAENKAGHYYGLVSQTRESAFALGFVAGIWVSGGGR